MQALLNEQEWEEYKRLKAFAENVDADDLERELRKNVEDALRLFREFHNGRIHQNMIGDAVSNAFAGVINKVRAIQAAAPK